MPGSDSDCDEESEKLPYPVSRYPKLDAASKRKHDAATKRLHEARQKLWSRQQAMAISACFFIPSDATRGLRRIPYLRVSIPKDISILMRTCD
jgi:hypothetical protein